MSARYVVSGPSSGEQPCWLVIDTSTGKVTAYWTGGREGAQQEADRLNAASSMRQSK